MRKLTSIAIVIGLAIVALQANFGVSADWPAPPKVISGFVGQPNIANASNAVLYLTTNWSGPLVTQSPLDPGAAPDWRPTYAVDIGSTNYNWTTADEVLAVFETVRSLLWTSINYTTSEDAPVDANTFQELPVATLEPYPVVTSSKTASDVTLDWTAMTDTSGNIENYGVLRSLGDAPPYTQVGTVTHVAGARTFTDSGVSNGLWCYRVNVLYRRNQTGTSTYPTTGTSEPTCQTISSPPTVISHYPANGAVDIPLAANIYVNFSKPMNIGTVTFPVVQITGAPIPPTFTPSWPTNTNLVLTHSTPMNQCRDYNVTIDGDDTTGVSMTAPYPFQFSALCPNPQILSTTPASNDVSVIRTVPIVITFTKAMDTTTGQWSVNINPGLGAGKTETWSGGNTILTIDHPIAFALGQAYTVTVVANDTTSMPLVPGTAANPWTFTANNKPSVTVTAPTGGCYAGGEQINITYDWTDESLPAGMDSDITYRGTASGSVTTQNGLPGNSVTVLWTPSGLTAVIQVDVNLTDQPGDKNNDTSGTFEVDGTAPDIGTSGPTGAAPVNTRIFAYFTEDMDKGSVERNVTFNPTVTNLVFDWGTTSRFLNMTATLQPNTPYTVAIGALSKDNCGVGNQMAQAGTISFTTGGRIPKAPTLQNPTGVTETKLTLTWVHVTQYTDDTTITGPVTYQIWRAVGATGTFSQVTTTAANATTYENTGLTPNTQYRYYIIAVAGGESSAQSNTVTATTLTTVSPPTDSTWLYILIIVIIVVVVLLAVLMMKRKKPTEAVSEEVAPPEEGAPAEEAPPEEAPPAEAPPEEPLQGEAPPEGTGGEEPPPPA